MAPEIMAPDDDDNDDNDDNEARALTNGCGGGGECGYDARAGDLFALGVLLWELWSRRSPWAGVGSHALVGKVLRGKRPSLDHASPGRPSVEEGALPHPAAALAPALAALLDDCWAADPLARPSARDLFRRFDAHVGPELRAVTAADLDKAAARSSAGVVLSGSGDGDDGDGGGSITAKKRLSAAPRRRSHGAAASVGGGGLAVNPPLRRPSDRVSRSGLTPSSRSSSSSSAATTNPSERAVTQF